MKRCGPFELIRKLGEGGMGEVWEATHGTTPVAVKFITLHSPKAQELFADEIRAHASLMHPHVLQVLDMGELEENIPGGPEAGTAWMALEHVSGGDLAAHIRRGPLPWADSFVVLAAVLEALSHAHARGVVHRDLKPANILLATEADARPGVKLADFGVAHVASFRATDRVEEEIRGTATSMAPEQCRGAFREYGPWTDLYAIGCMATRLVQGKWPFHGYTSRASVAAHLHRAPPALQPWSDVPPAAVEWIVRLMQKKPHNRYQSAQRALLDLWDLVPEAPPSHEALRASRAQLRARLNGLQRAFPTSWHRTGAPPTPAPLVDAGLALFPLRSRPTIGHRGVRDQLWQALGSTLAERRPSAVWITGPEGSGISHVGQWLVERAQEEDVARTFTVEANAEDAPEEALLRTLRQTLNVEGLVGHDLDDGIEINQALWGQPDPGLHKVLCAVLRNQAEPEMRRGALQKLVVSRAGRGGIVWIDDAHHAPDALRFALDTIAQERDVPLLFVLGAREEEQRAVDFPPCPVASLGPLRAQMLVSLYQRTLPVCPTLESAISLHTKGYSGRIFRTLDRLVQDRALVNSGVGYAADTERLTRAVDVGPYRAAIAALDDAERAVLTRATVLGSHVPEALWIMACDDPRGELGTKKLSLASATARFRVLSWMKGQGLAHTAHGSWRITDPVFREDVRFVAAQRGDLAAAHSDVADALRQSGRGSVDLARHLEEAGRFEESLAVFMALLDGHRELTDADRGGPIRKIADLALALADRMNLSMKAEERDIIQAHRAMKLGAAHRRSLGQLTLLAETHGWSRTHATAIAIQAVHEPERIEARLAEVIGVLNQAPECYTVMTAYGSVATALFRAGAHQKAIDLAEIPLDYARRHGLPDLEDLTLLNRYAPQAVLGVHFDPQTFIERAKEREAAGRLARATLFWVYAAEAAMVQGDLDLAERANLRALTVGEFTSENASISRANLAVIGFERLDGPRMRAELDRAWVSCQKVFRKSLATLELCWAVLDGDADVFANRLDRLERELGIHADQDFEMLEKAAALSGPLPAAVIRAYIATHQPAAAN